MPIIKTVFLTRVQKDRGSSAGGGHLLLDHV
jgi:hypothetical protein